MCKHPAYAKRVSLLFRCPCRQVANLPPPFSHDRPSPSEIADEHLRALQIFLMRARFGLFWTPVLLVLLILAGCRSDDSLNARGDAQEDSVGSSGMVAGSPDSLLTVFPDDLADVVSAPDFSLPGLQGEFSLADQRGKVVVLNFWATWNELSVGGMSALDSVQTELGADGIAIVGIAQDKDGLDLVTDWAADNTVGYPLVADASQAVAREYGDIELLPTTIIVDREGFIRERHTGILTHDELLDLIGPILIEEEEPLSELPSVTEGQGPRQLSPVDVHALVANGAMLIDIRSLHELEETGTAASAEHHPLQVLVPQDLPANFGVPIIFLGDENGDLAKTAAERALDWGYASVYVVAGGLTAWRAAGLPIGPLVRTPQEDEPLFPTRTVIG